MKTELQKLAGLTRRLNIEVPIEIVNKALERQYQAVQRDAKFKGFRPGKAPLNMVKAEYKSRVEQEVALQLIQDHYGKALDQHDLNPVNSPEIEFDGYREGQPLRFSATFEVQPDVKLEQYQGLQVQKEILNVQSETIDQIIEDIRKSKATITPVIELRAIQMGDVAIIDFHGKVEGKDLPGGQAQEYMLELGSKQFIPGFEENIVGMQTGQSKTINLKFPDDYQAKDVAGKDVEFAVTLKEIKKKVLPELTDEFAKSLGSHESLQHLKDEIGKDIFAREEKRIRDELKDRILHTLVEKNPFEIPQSMVTRQREALVEDIHQRMENQGMTHEQFDEYKKKWDADFTKSAEFVVHSSLLINAIAKKENLACTDEELAQKLQDYSKQTGIEQAKINSYYAKPESRSRLKFQMTEEKVMNFLIEKAKLSEVTRDKLKK